MLQIVTYNALPVKVNYPSISAFFAFSLQDKPQQSQLLSTVTLRSYYSMNAIHSRATIIVDVKAHVLVKRYFIEDRICMVGRLPILPAPLS